MNPPLQPLPQTHAASATNPNPNQGWPVLPPRVAIVEMLVLLVLPAALDHFWSAFPSLAELHPHPFWLPVLLLSLQYGTISGLLAAGLAIALSAVIGWPDQEVGENHFNYLLRIWAQPVLWLAAALVLGQFRMRQIERKQELVRQVAELSSQRTAIADHAANLRRRCDALEREIARRCDPSVRALLRAIGRLDAVGEAGREQLEARALLAECLELAFGRCQIAVFVRDGDHLRMIMRHKGSKSAANARDTLAVSEPLAAAVVGEGRPVSVMVPGEEAMLAGEGLVSVPIFSTQRDHVQGMLKLEQLDPSELDQWTSDRLAVMASHIAPLLSAPSRQWHAVHVEGAARSVASWPRLPPRARLWRQVKWLPRKAGTGNASGTPPRYG